MDLVFRYSSSLRKKRSHRNLRIATKNDSDIDIDTKIRKSSCNFKKSFNKKFFSKRLIILNIDWQFVNSSDIYSFLSPFVPKNGSILSVSILSLFKDFNNFELGASTSKNKYLNRDSSTPNIFFGLILCDSVNTSKTIFKNTNGTELNYTNMIIDLRFAPNFQKNKLKIIECVEKIPCNYLPSFIEKKESSGFYKNAFLKKNPENSQIFSSCDLLKKKKNLLDLKIFKENNEKMRRIKKSEHIFRHNIKRLDKINILESLFCLKDFAFLDEKINNFKNTDIVLIRQILLNL